MQSDAAGIICFLFLFHFQLFTLCVCSLVDFVFIDLVWLEPSEAAIDSSEGGETSAMGAAFHRSPQLKVRGTWEG